ncbi:MAG: FadR family transcriptional regulator [Xanthobacteraceae bacterium]|nr:FadR family transcriptional regulator [Xanthobacteraceae bacterium]
MPKTNASILPKVAKTSLVDEVISAIRKMLTEEIWAAGKKLPSELELSRQLGVGRSTVREALRVLGHLGLVESKSGLGTYVVEKGMAESATQFPENAETLIELFEFRKAIEVPAARLAAERRTKEQMKQIRESWDRCEQAVKNNSATDFARRDHVFHLSVVNASGNRFYIKAYEDIAEAFMGNVKLILGQGQLRSMLHFHDDLIEAIDRQNPEAAERAVKENFMETDVRLKLLTQDR